MAQAVSYSGVDVVETNSMTSKNAQPNYFHYLNTLDGFGLFKDVHEGGILSHDPRPMRFAQSRELEKDAILFYSSVAEAHAA